MPYSSGENQEFVRRIVDEEIRASFILDIGPGSGTYADLLSDRRQFMDAVEIWGPYVERFRLNEKYHRVFIQDVRELGAEDFTYDLVIFGDVLEHMSLEDAREVWRRCGLNARWGMISVPIVHYPQGEEEGNPYEVHVQDHLTVEVIEREFGPFEFSEVYDVTATFFKRFR